MLSKENRLTQQECDALLNQRTQIFHTPSLFVRALKTNTFKAAVAAPKKIFKRSVDRNRIRRVVYEALRDGLDIPVHVLISFKKESKNRSEEEIREEIKVLSTDLRRVFLETTL